MIAVYPVSYTHLAQFGIFEVFMDTIVICTITALAVLAGAQTLLGPHAGGQNSQGGDGADNDGIHEDFADTELGLTDEVIRIGGAVTGDGGACLLYTSPLLGRHICCCSSVGRAHTW